MNGGSSPPWRAPLQLRRNRLARRIEKLQQFAKGFAAVAMEIFFFPRNLREALAQRGEKENRVVAESLRAPRRIEQLARGGVRKNREDAPAFGQRHHADKARPPVAHPFAPQFLEQLADAVGIACPGAGVARRLDTGRAAER